jgi:formylglycine-generating enzyme required for sulfatase activity
MQASAEEERNLAVSKTTVAEKRIALVIGNGDYQYPESLPKLANPTNDAKDIADALRRFGFEVIEKTNLNREGMDDVIREFGSRLGDSSAALFYYAGHGLQVRGINYLVPVDAKIESEKEVQYKSVDLNRVLDEMDTGRNRVNIVMLDACRNNPISGKFRSGATRGLAPPSSQPKGTIIVYATDPGNTAADGNGKNGLFTSGILTAFKGKDLSLSGVLTRASEEVERESGNKQTPYINGPATLQKNFIFASLEPVTVNTPAATNATPQLQVPLQFQGAPTAVAVPAPMRITTPEEIEQETWLSARDSKNVAVIKEYIKQYPKGRFVGAAKVLIATINSPPKVPVTVIAPAKSVTEEPIAVSEEEVTLWVEAQQANSKETYEKYLTQYPKGKYAATAKNRIQKILDDDALIARKQEEELHKKEEEARKEQSMWDHAESGESAQEVQAYLDKYPAGTFVEAARAKLTALQAEAFAQKIEEDARKESELWHQAESGDNALAVQAYLDKYPAGIFAEAARAKLVVIQTAILKAREDFLKPGNKFRECPACPEMIVIPAGNFNMGTELGESDEKPAHNVTLSQVLAIGTTEVTQAQWKAIMDTTPSYFSQCGVNCPVENVSWDDVHVFLKKLNSKTGKNYRLPTEAEWEYACRSEANQEYCGGDDLDSIAWYGANASLFGNSASTTNAVGTRQPNTFGLFDMSGNVWEWVEDAYHADYNNAPTDGSEWVGEGHKRVVRGGAWNVEPRAARAADRDWVESEYRSFSLGFRVIRSLP